MNPRRAVTLASVAGGRDNNFNLIRMIAASGVLVSHAFPIALGIGTPQPLQAATGLTLGLICVAIFFALSGFLITRSFDRTALIEDWFAARIARLFPGLIVVSLLIALLYGPVFTTLTTAEYFGQPQTYTYVPRNVTLVSLQFGLPGVFLDLPYPEAINGSLWTLVHEVACYFGVFLAGIIGALASRRLFAVLCALYAAAYIVTGLPEVAALLPAKLVPLRMLSYPFLVGMALYVWRDNIRLSWLLAGGLLLLTAALRQTLLFEPVLILAVAYTTFVLAYRPGGIVRRYNALGDYSYGMYVYAFPVQQAAVALAGPMTPLQNMAVAFPITLACSVASWYLIEKPSLARRHGMARILGFRRRDRDAAMAETAQVSVARSPQD